MAGEEPLGDGGLQSQGLGVRKRVDPQHHCLRRKSSIIVTAPLTKHMDLPRVEDRNSYRRFSIFSAPNGADRMRAISLAEAIKIIEGTFASARKRKAYPLSAIVLDAGGRVKAFHKQDGSSLLRFE